MSFFKNKTLMFLGIICIFIIVFLALFAPLLTQFDPYELSLKDKNLSPSSVHVFGTDQNGTDIFSKIVFGARISLKVSFGVVGICLTIGMIIGSIAGYFGKWIDTLVMRFIDMVYAFPSFLLVISLVVILEKSINNLIIAMSITGWASYARLVRGEVLHLKTKEYVEAARALGASSFRIITLHIWPNLVGPIIVQATFGMAGTILAESSLSFLGLGAPPTEPTWGSLLNAGRKFLIEAPHISIFPGLAIMILVLGFNLFGDGLRDFFDPKKSKV